MLNLHGMFDWMLSISFLHVGMTDLYQMIITVNNPKTAKVCVRDHFHKSLIIIAFYNGRVSSNSYEY